jgi:diguanylate cyclase (GGDEF)-like protein
MPGKTEENATLKRTVRELTAKVEHLDQKLFDMSTLLQANKAFDNILEERELGAVFASIVHERFGVESYALFAFDEDGATFRLTRSLGLPADVPPDFSFPRQEGLLWQAALQGEPFSVIDQRGRPRFRVVFEKFGLEKLGAVLFVPLAQMGRVLGLLAVGPKATGEAFTETDVRFLSILAAHAAVSFNTTRVYEKSQRDKSNLDKTVKNLSILYNIGRAMVHITNLKNLLKFILGEAIKTTEAQKGSLMLYDAAIKRLVVRVVKGLPDARAEEAINNGDVECATFAPGEGIAGQVFQTLKPIVANAAEKDDRYAERDTSNVDSILCIPLIASDEPVGVINITNKKTGKKFTDEDVELLSALGNQAAVAINNATLYEMAITDELTKLFIRRYFNVRLDTELKRSRRYARKMTLAIADLDHFKAVNDQFGHQVGDAVLAKVAETIKSSVREIDTAARFGGEEFAIILPETDLDGAMIVADRVRDAVAKLEIPGLPRRITISIGLACYPEHAEDNAAVIRAADAALYEAKRQGRNRVCIYSAPAVAAPAAPADPAAADSATSDAVTDGLARAPRRWTPYSR